MSPSSDQIYDFDPRQLLGAFKSLQKGAEEFEKGVAGGAERMNNSLEALYRKIVTVTSRSEQAQNRYIKSIESTAAAYGKSGVEKLIAQRDQIIKRLGNEEDAVKRVTAAYAKMIEVEKNRSKGGESNSSGGLALRGLRDIFEGRTAVGEVQIAKSIGSLTGVAQAAGGAAAAFLAMGAAGLAAAKSVGEYANRVHEAEVITGLSAKQVQQFDYAAKVTGQDSEVLTRLTRGLTQAVEDNSSAGQRGQKVLRGMGVDLIGLRNGSVSTIDLFKQISSALEEQGGLWERNSEAVTLFKRIGITSIPMLVELNQRLRESEDIKFMSEEKVKEFRQVHAGIARIDTEIDQVVRSLKAAAAQPFIIALKVVRNLTEDNPVEFDPMTGQPILEPYTAGEHRYAGALAPLLQNLNDRTARSARPGLSLLGSRSQSDYLFQLRRTDPEAASSYASELKKVYDEARSQPTHYDEQSKRDVVNSADYIKQTAKAYQEADAFAKSLAKTQSDILSTAEALRRIQVEGGEKAAHPFGLLPAERELLQFQKLPAVTSSQVSAARSALRPQLDQEVSDILRHAGLKVGPGGQISRDELQIKSAGPMGFVGTSMDLTTQGESHINALGHMMQERIKEEEKDIREWLGPAEKLLTESRKYDADQALGSVRINQITAPDTAANRLAFERQIADIKIKAAGEELSAGAARAAGDKNEALIVRDLRLQYASEVNAAEQNFSEQRAQEYRRQLDEIKGRAESLFHTLFTNPKGFGSQLATTLRDAALKPIENRLADSTARFLQPMIFGGSSNRAVAVDGSGAALVRVVNFGSGGGAGSGGYFGGGSSLGGGAFSGGDFSAAGGGFSPAIFGGGSFSGGPGGTGGFAGPVGGGSTNGRFGGFHLPSLASLKDSFWNENINHLGGGTTAASSMGLGGKLAGILSSKGAGQIELGVGLPLAMHGLMGGARGTGSGIFQGSLGGALTGAGIGTMILPGIGTAIGAGIGAVVGAGIGIGEKIFGVESPINEAKRLAKSIYHLTIDSKIAQQIVSASQSFGGSIATTIRSPEIRNMLMLYSQATGQGNMLSSLTPRAGILQESGGVLSQQASFTNGTPYAYQSSLPIAGGFAANAWGGGSSNPLAGGLQINIGGAGAAQFMAGQFVTPENIQTQVSSAYQSSNNRVPTSALLSSPGLITS